MIEARARVRRIARPGGHQDSRRLGNGAIQQPEQIEPDAGAVTARRQRRRGVNPADYRPGIGGEVQIPAPHGLRSKILPVAAEPLARIRVGVAVVPLTLSVLRRGAADAHSGGIVLELAFPLHLLQDLELEEAVSAHQVDIPGRHLRIEFDADGVENDIPRRIEALIRGGVHVGLHFREDVIRHQRIRVLLASILEAQTNEIAQASPGCK